MKKPSVEVAHGCTQLMSQAAHLKVPAAAANAVKVQDVACSVVDIIRDFCMFSCE